MTSAHADRFTSETLDVRIVKGVLNHWPFPRGKGLVLRWFRPYTEGRSLLFELEPGVALPLDLGDYVIRYAFSEGYVGEPEVQLSRSLIRPGDTVVDVGAHIGLWVMGAARRAGRAANVHALEPVARNFDKLRQNLKRNGLDFVQCHRRACSAAEGETTIFSSTNGNSGMASLAESEGVDLPERVAVTTLDRFCAEASLPRVDFMKVDVEGAELDVFRGAARLLSSDDAPAVLFEVGDSMAARFGSSSERVKRLLCDHGYELFSYRGQGLEPVSVSEEHRQADLFGFKPTHFHKYAALGAIAR